MVTRLKNIVHDLNQEVENGALLVVEGKKDTMALRGFGFTGDCFEISQGGFPQFLHLAESRRKVILLLDYDRKGRYMFARALKLMNGKGIASDSRFRDALRAVTGGELRHVEDLDKYATE